MGSWLLRWQQNAGVFDIFFLLIPGRVVTPYNGINNGLCRGRLKRGAFSRLQVYKRLGMLKYQNRGIRYLGL